MNTATITKTATAQPLGIYIPTAIDAQKAAADFTVEAVDGSITTIAWKGGRVEFVKGTRAINKLKAAHAWTTNF